LSWYASMSSVGFSNFINPVVTQLGERDPLSAQAAERLREAFLRCERVCPGLSQEFVYAVAMKENKSVEGNKSKIRACSVAVESASSSTPPPSAQSLGAGNAAGLSAEHGAKLNMVLESGDRLCAKLAHLPSLIANRTEFLTSIKEIAATIKQLLADLNAVGSSLPSEWFKGNSKERLEDLKKEFVKASRVFSSTLKDYFKEKDNSPSGVFDKARMLSQLTQRMTAVMRDNSR